MYYVDKVRGEVKRVSQDRTTIMLIVDGKNLKPAGHPRAVDRASRYTSRDF